MATSPATFIFPAGRLRPAMLGVSNEAALIAALEQYLADGEQAVAGVVVAQRDAALRAFVYWQAFDAIVTLRATSAQATTVPDDYAESYTGAQLVTLKTVRDEYRRQYEGLLPVPTTQSVGRAGSDAVTEIVW